MGYFERHSSIIEESGSLRKRKLEKLARFLQKEILIINNQIYGQSKRVSEFS